MERPVPNALPAAQLLIRGLRVLNVVLAAAIFGLLVTTIVNRDWAIRAIGLYQGAGAIAALRPLQLVAVLGILSAPVNDVILGRLLAIVHAVRDGDPFAAENAPRLQAIGWALVALQLIGGMVWLLGKMASRPGHPLHLDAGFSAAAWLAVLLSFVLARVFQEGNRIRADIEGTV